MWVPMSAVYLAAGLALAGRFVTGCERRRAATRGRERSRGAAVVAAD